MYLYSIPYHVPTMQIDHVQQPFLVTLSYILSEFIEPGFMSVQVSNKASKTIDPPGKPEGNTTHRMRCVVSPEIDLMGGCKTHVFTT